MVAECGGVLRRHGIGVQSATGWRGVRGPAEVVLVWTRTHWMTVLSTYHALAAPLGFPILSTLQQSYLR